MRIQLPAPVLGYAWARLSRVRLAIRAYVCRIVGPCSALPPDCERDRAATHSLIFDSSETER